MGISSDQNRTLTTQTSRCTPSPSSPLSPPPLLSQLAPQPHITPQLQPHIMPQLHTKRSQNHTLSNTVLPMTTPELTSTLKRPLTARPKLDLTPLTTTTVSSLMSNTKVPQSTQNTSPSHTTQLQLTSPLHQHTTQHQLTLKKLPQIISVQIYRL